MATDSFIRLDEVLKRTSLSRATLYRKIKEGSFPAQTRFPTAAAAGRNPPSSTGATIP
jgi:prophage regulatory protein